VSDYSRTPTAEETEEELIHDKLEDTRVSELISKGITLRELRTLLTGKEHCEYRHTATALARKRNGSCTETEVCAAMRFEHDTNLEHAKNPKVGDYWQEMFCPVAVVISVSPFYVLTLEKKKTVDDGHWTWDIEAKPCVYTRKEFVFRFTYGYCGDHEFQGYEDDPENIKNKYYCDVMPEQHKWIEEELACLTES
jgi:hypothetical protein